VQEERRLGCAPEGMTNNPKGAGRLTESSGDLGRGPTLDKKRPQRFVLAVLGQCGAQEKPPRIC
jgi:hypothetical protein